MFFKKTVQIKAMIEDIATPFFESSEGTRTAATYSMKFADYIPEIEADDNALSQVLLNLLDNAVKYASFDDPDHKTHIDIVAETTEHKRNIAAPSKTWIRLSVSDNGPGIAQSERKRIFRPYFRSKSALNANVSGVGLGLALCRHIVRSHGGWIESGASEAGGAVFSIYLPCPQS